MTVNLIIEILTSIIWFPGLTLFYLFNAAKSIGLHGGDPVGAEVDATGRDASEGIRTQSFDVIVI